MSTAISQSDLSSTSWERWLTEHRLAHLFDDSPAQPPPFLNLEWRPTRVDRRAAWRLMTELRTRIATQPLPHRSGDEGTALKSIFDLFQLSRGIIKQHFGCTHVATLTVWVLNQHVRPFTARWHAASVEGRLASADIRFHFRAELAQLQPKLREFTRLLALIAGDETQVHPSALVPPERQTPQWLMQPVRYGVTGGTPAFEKIAAMLNEREQEEIEKRRERYGCASAGTGLNAVGLAISGGGIRSATFALGIVQQLARKGILRQVDYLSTVSGGGYLGGFISSFLNADAATLEPKPGALPFGATGDRESIAVRQLRNHSKYLVEGGARTLATIVGLVAYGLLTSVFLFAPLLLTAVLLSVLLGADAFAQGTFQLHAITQILTAVLAVGVLGLPIAQRMPRTRRVWERGCVLVGTLVLLALTIGALPALFGWVNGHAGIVLIAALASPLLLGIIGVTVGPTTRIGKVAFALFVLVGPLVMLAAYLWLLTLFEADLRNAAPSALLWALTVAAGLYATFVVNINTASPHPFYRGRLSRTYLVRPAGEELQHEDTQRLSEMNATARAPYHLVNCAINVPASKEPDLRGRRSDFFFFSKHFSGSPICGVYRTTAWEAMDAHLNLGTAVAISGAAAAPHMGTLTSARYTFLLALLNIRLGYWLRRPGTVQWHWLRPFRVPSLQYYLRELTGQMNEKTAYLNLSDGGHIENLGIYELLRRRCKFIIAIDGEADPQRSFGGLLTLTQQAKIDLGVNIEPDLSDLRIDSNGLGRSHFGMARIEYPGGEYGVLLYIKSSLTGNESEFLKKFQREHPDFPHQSTAQQLYSETQFEAYRELGEHVAHDLFRDHLVPSWNPEKSTVEQWFAALWSKLGAPA